MIGQGDMQQMEMFPNGTDYGKPKEKTQKHRWYIITRKHSTEALYLINGRHEWREYDPLVSVPHAITSVQVARNVASNFSGSRVQVWPYGVLRPGRSK